MSLPGPEELRELLGIEPPHGVLSVYVRVDRADRAGGWRIALADALRDAVSGAEQGADRELSVALRATAERVLARFGAGGEPPEGNAHVGLLEISERGGGQRWWASAAAPRSDALAVVGPRPHLLPLLEMVDDNRRRGVVAVSGERARLLEWEEAELSEIEAREIVTRGDPRERKTPRNADIPTGQAPGSSGRDLYEQRLDDYKRRFMDEIADLAVAVAERRGWSELLCFGEAKYLSELSRRLGPGRVVYTDEKNLIPIPEQQLTERLAAPIESCNRRRELALISQVEEAALAGGRGTLGLSETASALSEGRVEHLLIADAELPARSDEPVFATLAAGAEPPPSPGELLIERALATGAAITPVEGEAAERLVERQGAAAILRY
jgi:hypothetical protein